MHSIPATFSDPVHALRYRIADLLARVEAENDGLDARTATLALLETAFGAALTFSSSPDRARRHVDAAVDKNAPGGPSLTVRYDPAATSPALAGKACGNPVLRLLTLALADKDGGTYDGKYGDDLVCGLNGTVSQLPVPVGAAAPDLTTLLTGAP